VQKIGGSRASKNEGGEIFRGDGSDRSGGRPHPRTHVSVRASSECRSHVRSRPERAYRMLGHLSFKPSSQRTYSNSAIGDLRAGSASGTRGSDVEGSPLISCSSVTTSPFEVISLFLMILLCGNNTREVFTCCFTALFLRAFRIRKPRDRGR
jgi:hypothetical protein